MDDRIILTIEELKEVCPECFEKIIKDSSTRKINVRKVSVRKLDYDWLKMNKNDRPPKEWFDNCVASVSQKEDVDDPAALCGWVWYHQMENDEEATIPDTEDAVDAIKEKMKQDECLGKLRKDIDTVMNWRKFGRPLNKEQQRFADKVADEMIGLRVSKQVGIQLISSDNIKFIKKGIIGKGQPVLGSDAVAGITQDVVSNVQRKSGKFPRKTEEKEVEKVAKPADDKIKATLPLSESESGNLPRKTTDIKNDGKNIPDGQRDGEVSAVIDSKTDPKQLSPDDKGGIDIEEVGHHPNLPIPKKIAEELIQNVKWGVEIGVYTNMKEGIERQLGRKDFAEFIDTDEKLKAVISYLNGLKKE